jgi:hypothetical protein
LAPKASLDGRYGEEIYEMPAVKISSSILRRVTLSTECVFVVNDSHYPGVQQLKIKFSILNLLHETAGKLWTSGNWLIELRDKRMTVDKMTNDDSVAYELNAWESTVPWIYSIIHLKTLSMKSVK